MSNGLPKIAILGYGRAGKDEAGAWLGSHTKLRYMGSTSMVICPLIAAELGVTVEEAWNSRHANRIFWKSWADNYRKDDPAKLARYCLERGEMVVGLRGKAELDACIDENLFDLIIWIHREVPVDPTVDFSRTDCDVVVDNLGTLDQFHCKLAALARFAGLEVNLESSS